MEEKFTLPLLLFDSKCTLCTRFKLALQRVPGTEDINMVSIHEDSVYESFPQINKDDCHAELHLLIKKEEEEEIIILKGGDALAHLVTLFPVVKKFSWLMKKGMGKKALDYFYDVADKYRETLLKDCDDCKKKRRKRIYPDMDI